MIRPVNYTLFFFASESNIEADAILTAVVSVTYSFGKTVWRI